MKKVEFDKFARSELHRYLLGMGIYPNTSCYCSLTECVIEAAGMDEVAGRMREIYESAAKKMNKSAMAVERGLRVSLQKCMEEKRMTTLNDYFGFNVYRPNFGLKNSEIISLLAFKLRDDFENN